MAEEKQLISYCGICCSLCPAYREKNVQDAKNFLNYMEDAKLLNVQVQEILNVVFCVRNFLVNYLKKDLIGI